MIERFGVSLSAGEGEGGERRKKGKGGRVGGEGERSYQTIIYVTMRII